MAYEYKREPLNRDETARLENACQTPRERLVVWTLLDTGRRVGELSGVSRQMIDWQGCSAPGSLDILFRLCRLA